MSDEKVSFEELARLAGVPTIVVEIYYGAWLLVAKDGLVPHPDEMLPGSEIPEPDIDFETYLRKAAAAKGIGPEQFDEMFPGIK